MRDLRERLANGPVIVADGAMGSLLQQRGHAGCLEGLNTEAPEAVREVHREYREAGAEILWTNSFGGSPRRLAAAGLANRTEEINEAAARIAREAADEGADQTAWVAGSVGPCGAPLAPFGDLDPEEMADGARRQIRGLVAGGVDAIVVETMMDLTEAVLALRAAREVAPDLPVFVTLTFQETPSGLFTPYGTPPGEAAATLAAEGAAAFGANCATGPGPMREVLRAMREATGLPLLAKPNAGMPQVTDEGTVWPESPETFAAAVRELKDLGAALVGGCCGTTPAHVQALRARL